MTIRRIISIIIAAAVAMLIIFAGKSCAQNIAETNQKAAANKAPIINNTPDDFTYSTVSVSSEAVTTDTTTDGVEVVTNLFGEVIGTVPPTTSENPDVSDPNLESASTETTTVKSILDGVNEPTSKSNQHSILGGNQPDVTETVTGVTQPSSSQDIVIHIN